MDLYCDFLIYGVFIAIFFLLVAGLECIITVVRFVMYRIDQKRYISRRVREDMMEYYEHAAKIEKVVRREAGREYRRQHTFEI